MSTPALTLPPREFDVCGPLPTGVTVLEASAGTGKTYTIAGLAARYVAEGVPLDKLLLVTFTRIATGELRERVRERLVTVEQGLSRAIAGTPAGDDPVVRLLARHRAQLHRRHLAGAVAGFDAATIATTHGFCQEVLGGLGIAGDLEPDVGFVEDLSDLADDVVDDLYVRRFHRREGGTAFRRAEAIMIARTAINNPTAPLVGEGSEAAQMRVRLALAARVELDRRKRAMAVMTYDDLVTRLVDALSGPAGPAAAARLRERFEVVLVDEFQDTDPAQWEIMQRAFAGDGVTLVLIADPKQAIYAFRGADVYAYLDAARTAGDQATLPINWRSDQGLIDAHDALFSGVKLGHEGIPYRHVRAADAHQPPGLSGAPVGTPLRIRALSRDHPDLSLTPGGLASAPSARRVIAGDLAGDVVALLDSQARVTAQARVAAQPGADDGEAAETLRPGHLAVLVRSNRQAAEIRDALQAAGVPAVINGAGSVFETDAAREWLRLLEALERPASVVRAHSAAVTSFLGWSAERLAAASDHAEEDAPEWEQIHRRLHDWARVLRTRGVASLLEAIAVDQRLPARVLAQGAGERRLTDLRHVGQLLHAAATAEQLGPTALTAWLRTRIAEAEADNADEERTRRLESDAEAVQVLTIHRSKGLEFPIVYLPFLWDTPMPRKDKVPAFFHDVTAGDARTIDVGLEGATYERHREQFTAEERGEDLRLAYVALTRARHQAVVWWAGSYGSRNSPLTRLLFSRSDTGDVAPAGSSTPSDPAVLARLTTLADGAEGAIAVEPVRSAGAAASWNPPLTAVADLEARRWERALDLRWRRTSYTDITAASHDAWVGSEPEVPLLADEPPDEKPVAVAPAAADGDPALAALSPLAGMGVGTLVGTVVHRVMELSDFAAPDLGAELAGHLTAVGAAAEIGPLGPVADGLARVVDTPLGAVLDGLRLRDVARADRLDELGFELPLAGGDTPRGWLTLGRIAALLREHLPAGDPLAVYAQRLQDPRLRQRVRGYLTGSLDLVVRLGGRAEGHGERFAVLDYKTNWLGAIDEPLTVGHYHPEIVAAEMGRHHYALQALLYVVALHRFLRWRLPGYEPGRHLAGVVYLFVRGMTGPETPVIDGVPCGVFGWRPPAALVTALSDALDAGDQP